MLTVYHCTTEAAARQILAEGFRDTARDLTNRAWTGVWVSDRPLHNTESVSGVLQIEIAEEIVAPYEWVKYDKQFREWLVPAVVLDKSGQVTLHQKEDSPQR